MFDRAKSVDALSDRYHNVGHQRTGRNQQPIIKLLYHETITHSLNCDQIIPIFDLLVEFNGDTRGKEMISIQDLYYNIECKKKKN